jgi:hypothetical protein
LIWLLNDSVTFTKRGNPRPKAAWTNALYGLTARLLPIGADPGGTSNPHRHKNPLCPLWHYHIMAEEPYSIDVDRRENAPGFGALRPHLPSPREARDALRQATEARMKANQAPSADHDNPSVAAESNALFRRLAIFARKLVVPMRDEGRGNRQEFGAELAMEAVAISPPGERHEHTARCKAASIAKWTWDNYRAPQPPPALAPEERHKRLAAGARSAANVKRSATQAAIIAAIQHLTIRGKCPTQAAVAETVNKSLSTVKRYWAHALRATGEGVISPSEIKRNRPKFSPSTACAPRNHSTLGSLV